MKLDFALFANHAVVRPDGLFSMLDGGIVELEATSIPAMCPNLSLMARFSFDADECGKEHKCVVKVTSPSGNVLEPDAAIVLKPTLNTRHPSIRSTFTAHFGYDRFACQEAGTYRFSFHVGESFVGDATLEATLK